MTKDIETLFESKFDIENYKTFIGELFNKYPEIDSILPLGDNEKQFIEEKRYL